MFYDDYALYPLTVRATLKHYISVAVTPGVASYSISRHVNYIY
jgi:hypothetical protein